MRMVAFTRRARGLVLAVLFATVVVAGCQPFYPELSLRPPEDLDVVSVPTPQLRPSPSRDPELPFIRLAAAPVPIRRQLRRLLDYLPGAVDQPVELILRSSYAEISHLIKNQLVDVAFLGIWPYVELEESRDVELLVVPQRQGHVLHHSYVIVPAGSPFFALEDLRNQKFLFTDPLSFCGSLYVRYRLATLEETPDTFFGRTLYSFSHHTSIIAVAEGWVNAAAVDSSVLERLVRDNPDLAEKVRVIEISPPVGNAPVVVSARTPAALRQALAEVFLQMHEHPEGQRVLAEMGVDRFVTVQADIYGPVRAMRRQVLGAER